VAGLQPGYQFTDLLIQLGDLTFGQVDDEGVHWHCATLEGWDSPDVRTQTTQRESDHGAWAGPVWLNERVITLAGKVVAPSRAALDGAIERLLAATSLTDTLLTVGESIPKQAVVRRSGKVLATRLTGTVLDWSVMVTAADPRRYGTDLRQESTALPSIAGGLVLPATLPWTLSAVQVTGSITALNEGSIAVRPLLTVTGPVSQPQVATLYEDGTVQTLTYALDLVDGEVLTLDTDAHTAMVGGATRRRWISGQWPQIPAQQQARLQFRAAAYDPAARLTVSWRPAWI